MPPIVYAPVVTADGFPVFTADGFRVVVVTDGAGTSLLTQLPLLAAYDYAVLEPFLNDAALAWATPPRES